MQKYEGENWTGFSLWKRSVYARLNGVRYLEVKRRVNLKIRMSLEDRKSTEIVLTLEKKQGSLW